MHCWHQKLKITDTIINPNVEKNLKQRILNDEFFTETCPKCQNKIRYIYPCIYADKQKKLILFMKKYVELHDETCHKRVVHSIEKFKEKILIYDAGLDDRAIDILALNLRKYCLSHNQSAETLLFTAADSDYLWFEVDGITKAVSMHNYLQIVKQLPKEDLNQYIENR